MGMFRNLVSRRFAGSRWRRNLAVGVGLAAATASMTIWPAEAPPREGCQSQALADRDDQVILASKVVVRPWYGPHHVFGIFEVPAQYRHKKHGEIVTLMGTLQKAEISDRPVEDHGDHFAAQPGRVAMHAHVRTRTALWFLLAGKLGDIENRCNWALIITQAHPDKSVSGSPLDRALGSSIDGQ